MPADQESLLDIATHGGLAELDEAVEVGIGWWRLGLWRKPEPFLYDSLLRMLRVPRPTQVVLVRPRNAKQPPPVVTRRIDLVRLPRSHWLAEAITKPGLWSRNALRQLDPSPWSRSFSPESAAADARLRSRIIAELQERHGCHDPTDPIVAVSGHEATADHVVISVTFSKRVVRRAPDDSAPTPSAEEATRRKWCPMLFAAAIPSAPADQPPPPPAGTEPDPA